MAAPKTTGSWLVIDPLVQMAKDAEASVAQTSGQQLDVESSWTVLRRALGQHVPESLQHANTVSRRLRTGKS